VKAVDFRQATWESVRGRLSGDLVTVLDALRVWGPCTTRELADRMQGRMSLLTVRPRVCDLCAMGAVDCVGAKGRDGVYAVRTETDWRLWVQRKRDEAERGEQLMLAI